MAEDARPDGDEAHAAEVIEVELPEAFAGDRIDRVVATVIDRSRRQVTDMVEAGAVHLDGVLVRSRTQRVAGGQMLRVEVPPAVQGPGAVAPDPSVTISVVAEDESFLVVDKAAGVVVHPGAGTATATLVSGLVAAYPELVGVGPPERPGIVHRLDVGTSGLMVVARTSDALEVFRSAMASRRIHRQYEALVWGHPEPPRGIIDAPIGRAPGDRTKRAVVEGGRRARTRYEVGAVHDDPVSVAQVTATLETGRTHQIRVHMASMGHPVVGDARYGGERQSFPLDRPFLHAARLGFAHPLTGEPLEFESALPPDLSRALARLG